MVGLDLLKCPECGLEAASARVWTRRRRPWRALWLALALALLAYAAAATPRTIREGWAGAVPTPALVVMFPAMSPAWDQVTRPLEDRPLRLELARRVNDKELGLLGPVWERVWLWRTRASFSYAGRLGVPARDRALLEQLHTTIIGELPAGATFEDALLAIRGSGIHYVNPDWAGLRASGLPESAAAPRWKGGTAAALLDRLCTHPGGLPAARWTVHDGWIVVHPANEPPIRVFASYDMPDTLADERSVLDAMRDKWPEPEETNPLISDSASWYLVSPPLTSLAGTVPYVIEPDGWFDNGGDTSALSVIGGRMAISAPAPVHEKVRRLLDAINQATPETPRTAFADGTLATSDAAATGRGPEARHAVRVYNVTDLLARSMSPDPPSVDPMLDLGYALSSFVRPNDWIDNGGDRAHWLPVHMRLVIVGDARLHAEVEDLLAKLRGPGQPLRRFDPLTEPAEADTPRAPSGTGDGDPPSGAEPPPEPGE
ncbi:MAG: hypothetical protein SFY69_07570 [Planctomycetota bacterium]|nr:hypothetical protein [Planctomycetota bacterium]